jgi:hypothetical protein
LANHLRRLQGALLFAALAGCTTAYQPIPAGTYASDLTLSDEILVSPRDIRFRVKVDERVVDRSYSYTVLPDGRIHPSPLVSSDIQLGVAKFDWFWDGQAIIQKEPRTGQAAKFRRQ